MAQTYVQYDKENGNFLGTIVCEPYYAAQDERENGYGLLPVAKDPLVRGFENGVPQFTIDWDLMRETAYKIVDERAEAYCLQYVTAGQTQMMRYKQKEEEARKWTADNNAAAPLLTAEANATNVPLADLVAQVLEMADAWVAIMARVESKRICAKQQIATSTNVLQMVYFANVSFEEE